MGKPRHFVILCNNKNFVIFPGHKSEIRNCLCPPAITQNVPFWFSSCLQSHAIWGRPVLFSRPDRIRDGIVNLALMGIALALNTSLPKPEGKMQHRHLSLAMGSPGALHDTAVGAVCWCHEIAQVFLSYGRQKACGTHATLCYTWWVTNGLR